MKIPYLGAVPPLTWFSKHLWLRPWEVIGLFGICFCFGYFPKEIMEANGITCPDHMVGEVWTAKFIFFVFCVMISCSIFTRVDPNWFKDIQKELKSH